MSHEPAVNIEAVTASVNSPVNSPVNGNLLLDLTKNNSQEDGPPPSCSRKLRKYSFLILVNKYVLYAVNCIIWLGGLFLVAFGVWARVEDSTVGYLQLLPFDPVALLIALGSLSVVISFLGCIGSIRENVLILKIFCGAIGCLFIVELASCVAGFISVNSIKDAVVAKFYSSMELYDDDDQIRGLVDRIQKDYQCCGAVGPNDWDRNVYYNCSSNFNQQTNNQARSALLVALNYMNVLPSACGVPSSCCRSAPVPVQISASSLGQINLRPLGQLGNNPIPSLPGVPLNDQCGYGIRRLQTSEQSSEIFVAGCADHITESLSQNLLYVAVVALAISCFELVSILLAFMLIRRVTNVLEFMAYVRSGRFVEVDPGHNNHLPLQVIITNEQHNHRRHNNHNRNHHRSRANGHAVRGEGRSNNKDRNNKTKRTNSTSNNSSSSSSSAATNNNNGVVQTAITSAGPVDSLHDIHI